MSDVLTKTLSPQTMNPRLRAPEVEKSRAYREHEGAGAGHYIRIQLNELEIQTYFYKDLTKPHLHLEQGITVRDVVDNQDIFIEGKNLEILHQKISRFRVSYLTVADEVTAIRLLPRERDPRQQEMDLGESPANDGFFEG